MVALRTTQFTNEQAVEVARAAAAESAAKLAELGQQVDVLKSDREQALSRAEKAAAAAEAASTSERTVRRVRMARASAVNVAVSLSTTPRMAALSCS